MTPAQLETFIKRWMGGAVDAFTNDRLETVLLALLTSGITDQYDTYDDFKAACSTDTGYRKALVSTSTYGPNRIFEYFPTINAIFWTASQHIEQL